MKMNSKNIELSLFHNICNYTFKIIQYVCVLSLIQLFVTPWIAAHQAPLSMGLPRQNTGVGCHLLLQEDLSTSGVKPMSPASPALAGGFFTTRATCVCVSHSVMSYSLWPHGL